MTGLPPALTDVWIERKRQIESEGFQHTHDDRQDKGELSKAAACYLMQALGVFGLSGTEQSAVHVAVSALWPWSWDWYKPKPYRRDLVRAAALLVAEIERVDRLSPPPPARSVSLDGSEA